MFYLSPYVTLFWTKRLVRYRPCGLRGKMRMARYKHRIKLRKKAFQIKCDIESLRKPYNPKKPERRNYNTFYGPMQIPLRRKT